MYVDEKLAVNRRNEPAEKRTFIPIHGHLMLIP